MNKTWIKDGKFIELKEDQLEGLSSKELAAYTADKTNNMIDTKIKELVENSQSENVTSKQLDAKVAEINKLIEEKLDNKGMADLNDRIEKLLSAVAENAGAIKAMNEKGTKETETPKTFREALKAAFMEQKEAVLTEKNDDYGQRLSLKDYFDKNGSKQSPTFTIKAAVDMLESNIAQSNINTVRLTELDPQRVGIPLTIYPHVMMWMPSKNIRRPYMSIMVVYTYEDGSGTKTEGSAPSKSSFLLKTVEFKAFYNATYFTLSDETLDDLDEVMDEIAVTAPDKILDSIDGKILGTSGDDSTDIAGLFTANKHTDYAAATYNGTVDNPTIIDLISKMKLQCEGNKYMPDAVILNPSDVEKISGLKNAFEDSKSDRRVVYNLIGEPSYIKGLRVITSTAITADTCAVVDSKQLMIGKRKDMEMVIGYNGTDLTEGQKTVVIKVRIAFGVRDKAAVIYSDSIAADVNTLTVTP